MKHAEIKLHPALRLCGDGETREKFYDVKCKKYFQLLPPLVHTHARCGNFISSCESFQTFRRSLNEEEKLREKFRRTMTFVKRQKNYYE